MVAESMSRPAAIAALQELRTAIDRLLAQNPAAAAPFRDLLSGIALDAVSGAEMSEDKASEALPVLRFWRDCIAGSQAGWNAAVSQAAASLVALTSLLHWQQNPNYRRNPPDEGFLAHYGYTEICGPKGLLSPSGLRFGVLLLGPDTCYPAHRHPAEEIYLPLQAALWQGGEADIAAGQWHERPAGSFIHHPPMMPHATRTTDRALAAFYLWRGEVTINARLDANVRLDSGAKPS